LRWCGLSVLERPRGRYSLRCYWLQGTGRIDESGTISDVPGRFLDSNDITHGAGTVHNGPIASAFAATRRSHHYHGRRACCQLELQDNVYVAETQASDGAGRYREHNSASAFAIVQGRWSQRQTTWFSCFAGAGRTGAALAGRDEQTDSRITTRVPSILFAASSRRRPRGANTNGCLRRFAARMRCDWPPTSWCSSQRLLDSNSNRDAHRERYPARFVRRRERPHSGVSTNRRRFSVNATRKYGSGVLQHQSLGHLDTLAVSGMGADVGTNFGLPRDGRNRANVQLRWVVVNSERDRDHGENLQHASTATTPELFGIAGRLLKTQRLQRASATSTTIQPSAYASGHAPTLFL